MLIPMTPSIAQNAKEAPISMPTRFAWQAANPDTLPLIEPSWGPLKRYTRECTRCTYLKVEPAAKWLFEYMQSTEGGPTSCTVRALGTCGKCDGGSIALKTITIIQGYVASHYLSWENVRMAALAADWTLIQGGYNRNKELVETRMEKNPSRRKAAELGCVGRRPPSIAKE